MWGGLDTEGVEGCLDREGFRSGGCKCFHAACIMRNVYPLLSGDMRYSLVRRNDNKICGIIVLFSLLPLDRHPSCLPATIVEQGLIARVSYRLEFQLALVDRTRTRWLNALTRTRATSKFPPFLLSVVSLAHWLLLLRRRLALLLLEVSEDVPRAIERRPHAPRIAGAYAQVGEGICAFISDSPSYIPTHVGANGRKV